MDGLLTNQFLRSACVTNPVFNCTARLLLHIAPVDVLPISIETSTSRLHSPFVVRPSTSREHFPYIKHTWNMTESVLESNNQERSKDILRETEDAPPSPAVSHPAVDERAHPGGDLAQEVGEDKAEHHPLHLVPPWHRPARLQGGKAVEGIKATERINIETIRELLFLCGLCSCRRRFAAEDGPGC